MEHTLIGYDKNGTYCEIMVNGKGTLLDVYVYADNAPILANYHITRLGNNPLFIHYTNPQKALSALKNDGFFFADSEKG